MCGSSPNQRREDLRGGGSTSGPRSGLSLAAADREPDPPVRGQTETGQIQGGNAGIPRLAAKAIEYRSRVIDVLVCQD